MLRCSLLTSIFFFFEKPSSIFWDALYTIPEESDIPRLQSHCLHEKDNEFQVLTINMVGWHPGLGRLNWSVVKWNLQSRRIEFD